jgi:dihydrofolate reductase
MRKLVAAINMTVDGFCDHTAGIADDELHEHYTDLLNNAGAILYGRITYQLMEDYWPMLLKTPSGNKELDKFALAIDRIPKVVFSRTLKNVQWESARLANKSLEEEISALRQKPGKDIFAGSPSLIVALSKLKLIDEYQLCVHPVVLGNGLPLFKGIAGEIHLKLLDAKALGAGQIVLRYERER